MAKEKNFLVAFVLAAILLVLLNLPEGASRQAKAGVRETVAPLHGLFSGIALRVREAFGTLRGLGGLREENRALSSEVQHLRDQVRLLQDQGAENATLRALLGYRARAPYRLVAAEVIAREPSGWWQSVRLNRGARDGLRAGQAVVTPDGLVGETLDVSDHTSDVLLMSDPACRVSCQLPRTGGFGVAQGGGVRPDGETRLKLDFLHRHAELRPGDEVVTSGLGGVYPGGLRVGYLENIRLDESGLYQSADVRPLADLATLRHVFVVNAGPPPAAPAAEPAP